MKMGSSYVLDIDSKRNRTSKISIFIVKITKEEDYNYYLFQNDNKILKSNQFPSIIES